MTFIDIEIWVYLERKLHRLIVQSCLSLFTNLTNSVPNVGHGSTDVNNTPVIDTYVEDIC